MAGKRQHYVPRLLQRGFLENSADNAERTWLHRPGATARLVGIRDVGVEDWFYSRKSADGAPTLDDAITDYEGDLSKKVRALREAAPGTRIDAELAAGAVVHLVLRAAHLRRIMSAGVTSATNELEALFTDPTRLGAMIGLAGPALSSAVTDAIRNSAAELVPAGFPSELTERLMTFLVREVGDELVAQAVATLGPLLPMLFGTLAGKVRDTHNSMLEKPLDDNGWVAALSGFGWSIEQAVDLILPDAVALSREENGPLAPLLFTTAADVAVVMMPVAHDRMLVGRRSETATIDLGMFNEQAASGCEGFFIAARSFDAENLSARIGKGPADALAESIAQTVREAEQTRSLGAGHIPAARPQENVQQNFSYRVTLADFGDDVLAKEYAGILETVVSALGRDLPLHTLDGITIAADYHDAIAHLDRGDPALPRVSSGALGYGVGVAKPVTVVRDGQRKVHLVVSAGLADSWTSPDPAIRAGSLHILVKMLAGIAQSTRYADAHAIAFTPDTMARELHLAVSTTSSGYWSARQAAFVDPDQGESYAISIVDSLDFADREIVEERGRMAGSSDIDAATTRAIECVSAVLIHVADWLGHRDGLTSGQDFAGSDLPDRLKARGLDRWIQLFGRDLAACYPPDGTLDISVVTTLSRHVERLLWSFGLYCWPDGDAMRCVVTDRPLVMSPLGNGSAMFGDTQIDGVLS
jgi:hypothetical protein